MLIHAQINTELRLHICERKEWVEHRVAIDLTGMGFENDALRHSGCAQTDRILGENPEHQLSLFLHIVHAVRKTGRLERFDLGPLRSGGEPLFDNIPGNVRSPVRFRLLPFELDALAGYIHDAEVAWC